MSFLSKLNARDRNLLIVLAVAIVFYLCYALVLSPGIDKAILLSGEIEAAKAELASAKQIAGDVEALATQERQVRQALAGKYTVFFTDLTQGNLLHRLDGIMTATGLKVNQYMPTPITIAPVVQEQGEWIPPEYPLLSLARQIEPKLAEGLPAEQRALTAEGAAQGQSAGAEDSLPCLEVMIHFDESTYGNVHQFLKALEQMNKTVVLRSMDFSKSTTTGLQGQMILDFYTLPGFDSARQASEGFVNVIPRGKTDPFQ